MSSILDPELSNRSKRRLLCMRNVREVIELHKDNKQRVVRRGRFLLGLYLDRSKYKP